MLLPIPLLVQIVNFVYENLKRNANYHSGPRWQNYFFKNNRINTMNPLDELKKSAAELTNLNNILDKGRISIRAARSPRCRRRLMHDNDIVT